MNTLGLVLLGLALLPLLLILANLPLYRAPKAGGAAPGVRVSVLIPARNEAATICDAVSSVLRNRSPDLEVLVLDDGSTDATASIVQALARSDDRVRLLEGTPLPAGWNGKPHACAQLAAAANGDWLLFVDADVRLAPDAVERLVTHAERRRIDLLSGIPRQETRTLGERLVIPLIHFVLLGYLPMLGMRLSRWQAFAAGIGQLFLARRSAYGAAGGHGAIRASLHDGVTLPRAFRRAGQRTDLVDATPLATCRMYRDFPSLWQGFAKNAHEGMGAPGAIGVWTVLLLGGHVLPWITLVPALALAGPGAPVTSLLLTACACSLLARLVLALRFGQSFLGALLHPVGVALIVAIQWHGLLAWKSRRPIRWKGRAPA